MTDDFYLASVPEPVTLLGLRLRPLSLGHIILLNRVKSAFVCGGIPTYEDLALSVFICSQTFSEAVAAFEDSDLHQFMAQWHAKLTGASHWLVRLGLRKPKLIELFGKSEEFAAYLKTHSKIPKYSFNPSDCKEMACPSAQLVKVTLMKEMKFSEAEILDRSWLLCLWDYVTLKALAGQVTMYDEEKVNEAQGVAEQLAAMVRDGKLKV